MTLPDYFMADLPPEAGLTPAMIAGACEALARNREKFLLPRTTDEIVGILCETAGGWLDPAGVFRRLALEQGPAQTGFSRPVLERGLDDFFRRFTPGNFRALLEGELGDPARLDRFSRGAMARGPRLLVHVAAGNLPNPALMSLVLGLLARSAQFMKCATGGAYIPRLFAHSLYQADRKLGACIELAEWPGGDELLEKELFGRADCLTATGGDEALASIRARVPASVRFIGHGRRASFGFVAREALCGEGISGVVARAADDVVAWDQNGCLSPHCFYVEERGDVESDRFAALLAAELMRREESAPRGRISGAESAAIASRRAMYETLAEHRGDVRLWSSPGSTAWTVVFEHETRFHVSPLNRFVFVKPVPDPAAALGGVAELEGRISTVGLAAPPGRAEALARRFALWGAARVCPLGRMQDPPLAWRHDGRPALGDLLAWTDFEEDPGTPPCGPAPAGDGTGPGI